MSQRNWHELKTWPEYFNDVVHGAKRFELRKDDREFAVGDTLILKEWQPVKSDSVPTDVGNFTGRKARVRVTYMIHGPRFGLAAGFCIMGFRMLQPIGRDE